VSRHPGVVIACVLAVAVTTPAGVMAEQRIEVPRFVEETRRSGIEHVYDGDFDFYVGGGVAVFDCDADGLAELYLAGGSNPAALYHNESRVGGALRFRHLPAASTDLVSVTGAYPLDLDGDTQTDLAVLRNGENVLLRGLGECRFERANEALGFDGGDELTTSFSATWEGPAALPTLAFGDYIDDSSDGSGWRCSENDLVRPSPGGTAYGPPTPLTPGWCPLSMLFSDWDRSGRMDLRISNDRAYYPADEGMEQLWRVSQGEEPRQYTSEDGWQRLQLWGMGIASHDVTGDGYPEVYLTSIGPNRLQTLADGPGRPTFTDISIERGVTAVNPELDKSLPSTAWHDEFGDVNNDGRIDLLVSKGNVNEMAENAIEDPSVLFLGQADGTFVDRARAAGVDSPQRGRGAALVDLNLDGRLDVVQVNRRDRAQLWRNVGSGTGGRPEPMGGWLALRLDQPGPNHDAIGAWIEVRVDDGTMTREVTVGGGHAGGQLGWIHFGLGSIRDSGSLEVRVQWPDGQWGPWQPVQADRFVILERGAARPLRWRPSVDRD
jgi:hypothetical protein